MLMILVILIRMVELLLLVMVMKWKCNVIGNGKCNGIVL